MLSQIKDICEPRDVHLYNHICIELEKQWPNLNILLHAFAYMPTLEYYSTSWLQAPTLGGGVKRRPHRDPVVIIGIVCTFGHNPFTCHYVLVIMAKAMLYFIYHILGLWLRWT